MIFGVPGLLCRGSKKKRGTLGALEGLLSMHRFGTVFMRAIHSAQVLRSAADTSATAGVNAAAALKNGARSVRSVIRNSPLLKPLALLFLFGSQVVNIINIKKERAEIERLYKRKIEILEECVERLEQGAPVDARKELALVNRQIKNRKLLKEGNFDALETEEEFNKSLGRLFTEEPKETLTQKSEVERIVIADTPGALEETASTRKITTFL